jgi:hypothetical protein
VCRQRVSLAWPCLLCHAFAHAGCLLSMGMASVIVSEQ